MHEASSPAQKEAGTRHDEAISRLQVLQATLNDLEARRKQLSHEALLEASSNDYLIAQPESEALAMARKTNQEHIKLLNQYNEIKDVATSLIGMIAENRQKRIVEVMQDFDVDEND